MKVLWQVRPLAGPDCVAGPAPEHLSRSQQRDAQTGATRVAAPQRLQGDLYPIVHVH